MAHYEVVVSHGDAGSDYISCDNLRDAKQVLSDRARTDKLFEQIFVRQYYAENSPRARYGYRVLHRLTVRAAQAEAAIAAAEKE